MDRKELSKVLSIVDNCSVDNKIIPIFGHISFRKDKIQAFNGVQGVSVPFQSGLEFTVKEDIFSKLINSFDSDIELEKSSDTITVKKGKSVTKISVVDNSSFISPFPNTRTGELVKLTELFINGIKKCITTLNKSNVKEAQNGITLKTSNGKISIFSTDGSRISKFETDVTTKVDIKVLLPEKFCKLLLSLYTDGIDNTMLINKDYVIVSTPDCEIFTSVNSNIKLYDFDSVLTKHSIDSTVYQEIPDEFRKAINRGFLLTNQEKNKPTKFTIDKNIVKLQVSSAIADMEEEIEFTTPFPSLEFKMDTGLLESSLKNIDELTFKQIDKGHILVGKSENYVMMLGSE